ncbi:MAG: DUF4965 domain-containing protein, partial [Paludibacter sp.]|nr:DUF4965 domain-containing protein [Paludibacter sp.]
MKTKLFSIIAGAILLASCAETNAVKNTLRAPAVPLVTIDPYTSAWSFSNNLYDSPVRHWTGKEFPLLGVIKVDGVTYRFLGKEFAEKEIIIPSSLTSKWEGKYTTVKPAAQWTSETFNDKAWKTGEGAFGTITKYTESMAKTDWMEEYIWVRRTIDFPAEALGRELYLVYTNDDEAEFYINGVKITDVPCCDKNALLKLPADAVAALKEGKNVISAYCHNSVANGLLDFGIAAAKPNAETFEQTAEQKSVDVQATQTHYTFAAGAVDLNITFTAPLLMNDLDLLSRPVNYLTYETKSTDGKTHDIELYFEASSVWALNTPYQKSVSSSEEHGGLVYLKTGSEEQDILGKKGDDVRIDWGYFYLVTEKENAEYTVADKKLALTKKLGNTKFAAGKVMLGYDDIYSIQYFDDNLRPYWNRKGDKNIVDIFAKANAEYKSLLKKCNDFDKKLFDDAQKAGGNEYAELCALAYRQSVAAHKLVEAPNGDLLWLSKENFSNGSIGTVDITYPSAPLYLYYNVELVKGLLNHIFYYSESGKWIKPFAAHDVGTYPLANGQTYGGDMPIEESGNMLAITAAVAAIEGNAKYAEKHWETLTIWTDYLVEKGLDPENQLCTDDFAGHFAHNTNLSVKAIMGIASYGYLAKMLGKNDIAEKYTQTAKDMAAKWLTMADDGDHYRLVFDKADTWSQKYNLVWNKLLKLNIFPDEVAQKEIAYYLTKQNVYGLPLDNRKAYTKSDWIIWT